MRQQRFAIMLTAALCACSAPAPPQEATPAPATATTASPATTAADAAPEAPPRSGEPAFVDTTWRVAPGSAIEAGTTYRFLRDGTLAIDAPHGTPAKGAWRYADGKLTMVEEGIAYPTDIVALDATRFVIRSHNPGGVIEIAMTADAGGTPPAR